MSPPSADEPGIEPLTEEDLESAEAIPSEHFHDGISSEDGTLEEHLRSVHQLNLESAVSASTLNGIHDRVHEESHAIDE